MSEEGDIEELMLADEVTFARVMECVFGIQQHETTVYLSLLEAPGSTVEELAGDIDRDRSTTHRSLAALVDNDLVERERRIVEGGGYVYQYFARSIPETQRRMHDAVDAWVEDVHRTIDEFGSG